MGFSDLLSSSRGPGVIGVLVALLVLGGFGTLFVVFDDNMQGGGKKIEAVVRDLGLEIEGKKTQVATYKRDIAQGERFKDQAKAIPVLKASMEKSAAKIAELQQEIALSKGAIEERQKAWDDYKVAYRNQVWSEAEGSQIGEVKGVESGVIYPGGKILVVNHTGIKVISSSGIKPIPLKDLPVEIREQYQLNEELAAGLIAKADADEVSHLDQVELAGLREMLGRKNAAIKAAEEKVRTLEAKVREDRNALSDAQRQISRMPGMIRAEERKSVSQAPQMRERLRSMQAALPAKQQALQTAQNTLKTTKGSLPLLQQEVRKIAEEIAKKEKEMQSKPAGAEQE